jgi:DNA-directed RNA polymerase specialized sigma subunit|tara:strand:- start:7530 stop:7667 length:138 start_codon:yes stop_codon:yes gene_type:complete
MSHQYQEAMTEAVFEDMQEELGRVPTQEEVATKVEEISFLFGKDN